MTLTETRRPRPTPPTPVCICCRLPITEAEPGEPHRLTNGRFHGKRHIGPCPVPVHVRVPPEREPPTNRAPRWDSPSLASLQPPIPTRPVQKHFSEAGWGRREGGAQWKTLTWWAIAAILFLIAVSGLVASYGGGQ